MVESTKYGMPTLTVRASKICTSGAPSPLGLNASGGKIVGAAASAATASTPRWTMPWRRTGSAMTACA